MLSSCPRSALLKPTGPLFLYFLAFSGCHLYAVVTGYHFSQSLFALLKPVSTISPKSFFFKDFFMWTIVFKVFF